MTNISNIDNRKGKLFFGIIIVASAYLGFTLIRPYLPLIAMTIIIALIYHPIFARLRKLFGGRDKLSSVVTILTIIATIIIPLTLILGVVATQVVTLTEDISRNTIGSGNEISIDDMVNKANEFLEQFSFIDYRIDQSEIFRVVGNTIEPLGEIAISNAINLGNTAFGIMTSLIIFLTLVSTVLINKDKLSALFKEMSPLDNKIDSLYTKRLSAMSVSMVKGTFLIAIVQGAISGVFMWLGGVEYIALWALLATLAALIPIGSSVVTVPIGVFLILTGNVWGGVIQILGFWLVTSNIDNLMRIQLVPKEASLHPTLTILGVFGGLKMFGMLGIIFGPMVMIFLVTTIEVYLAYYRQVPGDHDRKRFVKLKA